MITAKIAVYCKIKFTSICLIILFAQFDFHFSFGFVWICFPYCPHGFLSFLTKGDVTQVKKKNVLK